MKQVFNKRKAEFLQLNFNKVYKTISLEEDVIDNNLFIKVTEAGTTKLKIKKNRKNKLPFQAHYGSSRIIIWRTTWVRHFSFRSFSICSLPKIWDAIGIVRKGVTISP